MLGVAAPIQPTPAKPAAPAEARSAPTPNDLERPSLERLPTHTQVSGKSNWMLASVVALLLLGTGIWLMTAGPLSGPTSPPVSAAVLASAKGEFLELSVSGAPQGTRIRFGGVDKTLEAGSASFPLAPDSLRVGDNAVHYDLIIPGEPDPSSGLITLSVPFRVRADLSPLQEKPPTIEVVVNAVPGSTVTLNDQALALDPNGHGTRNYPIPTGEVGTGSTFEQRVHYRIQPPGGDPAEGELPTRIPVTGMQIDRPGLDVVTEGKHIEIAGTVAPEAEVTIDDQPVKVVEGRFSHTFSLPRPDVYAPVVSAQVAGSAPRSQTIGIRRVASLAAEAEKFEVDQSLTYVKVARNPGSFRGQRAVFEGRVYNVDIQKGHSTLQIFASGCSKGASCPLWVEYAAATEVTVDQWVRVLGTLAGEQQFRAESDRVARVPKLDAEYVLPLAR